jgi:hypothetical protein
MSIRSYAYGCPEFTTDSKDYNEAIELLTKVQGSHTLGKCHVEIRVCNSSEPSRSSNQWAEIFIEDEYGREQYAPLYYQTQDSFKSKTDLEAYTNVMYFTFQDRTPDALNGRSEAIRLDLRIDKSTQELKRIDLGLYGTIRHVTRTDGSTTSQWSTCKAK